MKQAYPFWVSASILLLTFMIKTQMHGQSNVSSKYLNFEQGVPSNWKGKGLSISTKRYKVGKNAIRWHWKPDFEIEVIQPAGLQASFNIKKKVNQSLYSEVGANQTDRFYREGGFMGWIYNETPLDDHLLVEFGLGTTKAYQFPFYLNFSGWRACWVRFSEMEPLSQVDTLDYMKFKAPTKADSGTLYFDRIHFSGEPIHHRSTPDQQVPFINPKVNHNHWGAQWYWESTYTHDLPLEATVTELHKKAFESIEKRLLEIVQGKVPHQDENWYYKDHFLDFNIIRNEDGSLSGRPIVSADEYDPELNDLKPLHLSPVFFGLARGYALTDDDLSKEMFLDLFDHFVDQGYDYGSATGTQHHFGYQFEGIPASFLLMKEALKQSGRLQTASRLLAYWYGNAEGRKDLSVNELQGVADLWNTKAKGRLIAILLMEDSPEKVREMKALRRFLTNSLQYSSGTVGGIKPDGSLYHHAGLYPAYMTGAFMGIAPVVYALSQTPFEIGAQARRNLVQSMLLMRNFSNKYDWPISLSGRQVFAGKINQKVIDGMGYVAKSGYEINKVLASAYMRLAKPWEKMYLEFQEEGIQPETHMDGFQVVNYACLGIHRREDWQVSVKGYSNYIWSSEIYAHDNRWGRYMSYGTIQINHSGNPINGKASGWVQNGWDWNRFPGTTTIHLPLDKLYCPVKTLMAKTDEAFCGSSSLEGKNGIFGMKLHEYLELRNFTPDHRARKSVFLFDDCLIALGSHIENSNADHPTETTLFQFEASLDSLMTVNGTPRTSLFSEALNPKQSHQITDNKGHTYFIPQGQNLMVQRQKQKSKHNKSERDTEGVFCVAYFNHGKAPKNAAYEYATLIHGAKSAEEPDYEVLQKDQRAHIVKDQRTGITGMVLFEKGKVKHDLVQNVSHESLVMLQKKGEGMLLSLCYPSINLGSSKPYDNQGSIPVSIELEIKGKWKLASDVENCQIKRTGDSTLMTFKCVDGKPIELKLLPV